MPTYQFMARDEGGRIQRGTQDATSPVELRTSLQSRGLSLVRLQEEVKRLTATQWVGHNLNPFHYLSPRSVDIELMLAQMAVMLRSGVTLLAALKSCEEQARFRPLKRLLRRVSESVQDGNSLGDAFAAEKSIPQIVTQMTRVGELTGNLDTVFDSSSKTLASRRRTINQTLTALAYPAFVAVVAIGVAAYMVLFVIPEVQKVVGAMGRDLPAMPQMLMDISSWIQINGATALTVVVGCVLTCIVLYVHPTTRLLLDRYVLKVPLIGYVIRLAGTLTFSSSMRAMIASGITLVEALRTTEQLHYNRHFANRVGEAREAVIDGQGLAGPISREGAYLPMLGSMVAVAENTGQMEEVLDHVTEFHEEQLQAAIKRLSALLEPLVVVFVGGIVGFVYISFFLALFSATGAL